MPAAEQQRVLTAEDIADARRIAGVQPEPEWRAGRVRGVPIQPERGAPGQRHLAGQHPRTRATTHGGHGGGSCAALERGRAHALLSLGPRETGHGAALRYLRRTAAKRSR